MKKIVNGTAAQKYNGGLHPNRDDCIPPPTKIPIANPKGVPKPRQPNAIFRILPLGNAALRMLTEVGKHMDIPIPCSARKTINWVPDCESATPRMKQLWTRVPVRLIVRFPMTSATAPERRRVQPHVNLLCSSAYSPRQHSHRERLTSRLAQAYSTARISSID